LQRRLGESAEIDNFSDDWARVCAGSTKGLWRKPVEAREFL